MESDRILIFELNELLTHLFLSSLKELKLHNSVSLASPLGQIPLGVKLSKYNIKRLPYKSKFLGSTLGPGILSLRWKKIISMYYFLILADYVERIKSLSFSHYLMVFPFLMPYSV